jgi:hypothetical protein
LGSWYKRASGLYIFFFISASQQPTAFKENPLIMTVRHSHKCYGNVSAG